MVMKTIFTTLSFFFFSFSLLGQTPSWSSDIACIIYTNCSGCHNENGIAPFSLLSYEDAYNVSYSIKVNINEGIMPPWPPDPDFREFANERLLTQEEIDLITAWVDGGAPEGDPALAPSPPVIESNEVIANPDMVVQLPGYTSNAVSGDEYRCFVIPSGLVSEKFVTGFEVVPDNRSIVHHMLVFQDDSNTPLDLDAVDPAPGYLCFGGVGSANAKLVGGWVPGSSANFYPQGTGVKLAANTNIVIQLHYPQGTAGETDASKINFKLTDDPGTRQVRISPFLNHITTMVNGPLFIPADSIRTFREEWNFQSSWGKITLLGAAPHMHLIGQSIKSWAETPAGEVINLVNIPHWDFEWQGFFGFRQAAVLPPGSKLIAEATYNNTNNNPYNPNNPPQDVWVGEATTDEMMLVYMPWLFYQAGDENMVFEDDTPFDCSQLTATEDIDKETFGLHVFPNPAHDILHLHIESPMPAEVILYDALGKMVESFSGVRQSISISTEYLPKGVYLLIVRNEKFSVDRKVIVQ